MNGGVGLTRSIQQPLTSRQTEITHLAIMHPERLQVVGVCARNDFKVVNLFHSLELVLDCGSAMVVCHREHTDSEGIPTEACRGHES